MNSVTFHGREITRQQIIEAINQFNRQHQDTNDYNSWLNKRTYRWAVMYRGKVYPPKYILSLASGFDLSDFSGGEQKYRRVFRELGEEEFEVIRKP